jgi:nitrite reductase/ring-hydroxylating ferredoxin subunit/uncharacterized membrane protein
MAVRRRKPVLHDLAEGLGEVEGLDRAGDPLAKGVREGIGRGPLKDLLSGTWLGHAVHPALVVAPIGAWTSALVLDLAGGRDARPAADRLVGVGVAAALPTAVSGLSDWADTIGPDRRVGLVHALANTVALCLYGGSYLARRRDRRGLGVALGVAGGGALSVGGYLGGHLAYSNGVGVDQTVFEDRTAEWTATVPEAELRDDVPTLVRVDGVAVVVVRHGGRVLALSDTCTHRGGALHEGQVVDGCVECPLHGSRFSLEDGSVERGPAVAPEPRWEARVQDGRVQVRAAG